MLNSNIRCIEISIITILLVSQNGWIVTLDVLKCKMVTHNLL